MPLPTRMPVRTVSLLLAVAPLALAAQTPSTPGPGDTVRFRIVAPATAAEAGECVGFVAGVVQDTVLVSRPAECPRGGYVAHVRVIRGDNGSRLTHTLVGLVVGGIVGGLISKADAGDGCVIDGCDDGGYVAGIQTMAGTLTGAATGALLCALLPAGPRWVDAGVRPIRVAGFDMRPELRVSIAHAGRRR